VPQWPRPSCPFRTNWWVDLVIPHDTHKLDVGVIGEIAMRANLSADPGPNAVADVEIRFFDENNKVGITSGNFDADDLNTVN
jgi:hypothetical protein